MNFETNSLNLNLRVKYTKLFLKQLVFCQIKNNLLEVIFHFHQLFLILVLLFFYFSFVIAVYFFYFKLVLLNKRFDFFNFVFRVFFRFQLVLFDELTRIKVTFESKTFVN